MKDIHTIYASVDSETKPLRIHKPNCGVFCRCPCVLEYFSFYVSSSSHSCTLWNKNRSVFSNKKNTKMLCKCANKLITHHKMMTNATAPPAQQQYNDSQCTHGASVFFTCMSVMRYIASLCYSGFVRKMLNGTCVLPSRFLYFVSFLFCCKIFCSTVCYCLVFEWWSMTDFGVHGTLIFHRFDSTKLKTIKVVCKNNYNASFSRYLVRLEFANEKKLLLQFDNLTELDICLLCAIFNHPNVCLCEHKNRVTETVTQREPPKNPININWDDDFLTHLVACAVLVRRAKTIFISHFDSHSSKSINKINV